VPVMPLESAQVFLAGLRDPLPQQFDRPTRIARFPGRLRQVHGAGVERPALAVGQRPERGIGRGHLVALARGLSRRGDRALLAPESRVAFHSQSAFGPHGPLVGEIDARGPGVGEDQEQADDPHGGPIAAVELPEAIAERRGTGLHRIPLDEALDVAGQAAGRLIAAGSGPLPAPPYAPRPPSPGPPPRRSPGGAPAGGGTAPGARP